MSAFGSNSEVSPVVDKYSPFAVRSSRYAVPTITRYVVPTTTLITFQIIEAPLKVGWAQAVGSYLLRLRIRGM
jgi:hypothetical protein